MRKFLVLILSLIILCFPLTAFCTGNDEITVEAKAAVLVDASSGKILFDKNGEEHLPIASVTKVMTLNLIFDAVEDGTLSLDESIKVSQNAAGMGGSQAFIDADYNYKASDLIKSIIIASANDAAVAMAERISGSEETFVVKMNRKAEDLGMSDTSFKNCTGLPAEGHYSTAADVAKMSRELLTHEDYFKWSTTWMDELKHDKDGRKTELVNTNKLIRSLAGCDGLKTGSTNEAKFCVTATAKRGDMRLISVILGGNSSKDRFSDAAKLINYGFANFENRTVVNIGESVCQVPLKGGKEDFVNITAQEGLSLCLKNDGSETFDVRLETPENVAAPVQVGESMGRMIVSVNGSDVAQIPLCADRCYEKAGFMDRLKKILSFWKQ